jgi:hypothetical protein
MPEYNCVLSSAFLRYATGTGPRKRLRMSIRFRLHWPYVYLSALHSGDRVSDSGGRRQSEALLPAITQSDSESIWASASPIVGSGVSTGWRIEVW